jgi:hypothetical protein
MMAAMYTMFATYINTAMSARVTAVDVHVAIPAVSLSRKY